ncbi:MAG TPA: SDR family NAD(P)-dependent oxidoreductase, partial [Pirellulales bacterium]
VVSDVAVPVQGIYSASKHAVKGFTEALRAELEHDGVPVSITLIKPTSIDTPLPRRSKNYTGRRPKLPSPTYRPEEVAYAILQCAVRPLRDVLVGDSAAAMSALYGMSPRTMDWFNENVMYEQQFAEGEPYANADTLHQPGEDGQVRGEGAGFVVPISPYTRAVLHPIAAGVAALAAGVAAMTFFRGRS